MRLVAPLFDLSGSHGLIGCTCLHGNSSDASFVEGFYKMLACVVWTEVILLYILLVVRNECCLFSCLLLSFESLSN